MVGCCSRCPLSSLLVIGDGPRGQEIQPTLGEISGSSRDEDIVVIIIIVIIVNNCNNNDTRHK